MFPTRIENLEFRFLLFLLLECNQMYVPEVNQYLWPFLALKLQIPSKYP